MNLYPVQTLHHPYRELFHLITFSFIGTLLYDWSGLVLDNRSIQTLHQAYQKLSHLTAIFRYLLHQASPTTEQGNIPTKECEKIIIVC
jgi:hypothetical protein